MGQGDCLRVCVCVFVRTVMTFLDTEAIGGPLLTASKGRFRIGTSGTMWSVEIRVKIWSEA